MLNSSVRLSRAAITSPPKVRRVGGFLSNFSSNAPDPIPRLETVQSHFQTEGEN